MSFRAHQGHPEHPATIHLAKQTHLVCHPGAHSFLLVLYAIMSEAEVCDFIHLSTAHVPNFCSDHTVLIMVAEPSKLSSSTCHIYTIGFAKIEIVHPPSSRFYELIKSSNVCYGLCTIVISRTCQP